MSTAEGILRGRGRSIWRSSIPPPCSRLRCAARASSGTDAVRAVAVIPSWDQFVFAVRPETGLSSFEDIARRKPKLRILMRGAPDHTLHHMFDDVAAAGGFSRDDIASWGGEVRKAGSVPWPHTETFKALISGDVDASSTKRQPPGCRKRSTPGSPSCRSPRRLS